MKQIVVSAFAALVFTTTSMAETPDWQYQGETGADQWGSVSAQYSRCGTGKNQSPVNIDLSKTADVFNPGIKFNYGRIKPETITNNGRYLEITAGDGTNMIVDGQQFNLKSLQIHIPSEHTINGKNYPLELQLQHQNDQGEVAMLSLLAANGNVDRTLTKILKQLPMQKGESRPLQDNTLRSLEQKRKLGNYYRYAGSLTSPPCSEGVRWIIMKSPITVSEQQIKMFKTAIKNDNNRPLQPLNARIVIE